MDVGEGIAAILPVHQEGDPAGVSALKFSADGLPISQYQHIGRGDACQPANQQ